jgi:hypothetical protein
VGGRRRVVVSRHYKAAPDYCARALELLLRKSVNEGGPAITAPDNDAKESKNDSAVTEHYT